MLLHRLKVTRFFINTLPQTRIKRHRETLRSDRGKGRGTEGQRDRQTERERERERNAKRQGEGQGQAEERRRGTKQLEPDSKAAAPHFSLSEGCVLIKTQFRLATQPQETS